MIANAFPPDSLPPTVATYVALLRAVNLGSRNRVPMADLRTQCEAVGLHHVLTYLQSGHLVFVASDAARSIEARLEALISDAYGLSVPVIVRRADAWTKYVASNPLPAAAKERPNVLHLCLSKARPKGTAVAELRERATCGERVESLGDAIWIDFASGFHASRIPGAVLDRAMGSSATTRNWNAVLRVAQLTGEA